MSTKTGVAPQYRMALAVAMNEWLAVITSSPGPTPMASNARWSAVVQFETAQAWAAPISSANSRSKAATCGPCETQPDNTAWWAASASAFSRTGIAIGITRPVPLVHSEQRINAARPATNPPSRANPSEAVSRL